jgi:Transposase Tn5 dimerisation domain/STAS-like domain of unknown function (DUF4325)
LAHLLKTKEAAIRLRNEKLLPSIDAQKAILIDFANVVLAPHSFLSSLLATPSQRLGMSAYKRVRITNAVPEIRETICPVESFEAACEKLRWYTLRWGIEVFHRTLKSGCGIEQRQLGAADPIEACLAIDLVVACRIFHLATLGREIPDVPCTVYFEDAQWKVLVAYITRNPVPPAQPPSLRQAMRMTATIGGFLGRKGDGEPGTKTLWLGLQHLDTMTAMLKILEQPTHSAPVSSGRYG